MKKLGLVFLCLILCLVWAQPLCIADTDVEAPILNLDQQSCTVNTQSFLISGTLNENGYVKVTSISDGTPKMIELDENRRFSTTVTLKPGENKINIVAVDNVGNKTPNNTLTIRYNPDAPMMTIHQINDMAIGKTTYTIPDVYSSEYIISGSLSEHGSVRFYLNDKNDSSEVVYTGSKYKFTYTYNLIPGNNKLYIVPKDDAGNAGTAITVYVRLSDGESADITPPKLTMDQPNDLTINNETFILSGAINEKGYVHYKINNGSWIDVPTDKDNKFSITLTVKEGLTRIRLQPVDAENNIGSTTAISVTYVILPTLDLDQTDSTVKDATFRLSGIMSKYGTVKITLNSGTPRSVATDNDNKFSTNLKLVSGINAITVQPIDFGGNAGNPVTIKVTLDTTSYSSTPTNTTGTKINFTDIKGHWAEAVIASIAQKGILSGFPDATFRPNDILTNTQVSVMFVKALNIPIVKSSDLYWGTPYIDAAINAGLIKAGEITAANRDSACSREYAAVLTARALQYNKEAMPAQAEIDEQATYITDWSIVKDVQNVKICTAVGVISGMPTGTPGQFKFEPHGSFTRAQGASIIERLLTPSKRVKPSEVK